MTPIYKYQKQKVIIAEDLQGSSAAPLATIVVNIDTRKRILVDSHKLQATKNYLTNKKARQVRGDHD